MSDAPSSDPTAPRQPLMGYDVDPDQFAATLRELATAIEADDVALTSLDTTTMTDADLEIEQSVSFAFIPKTPAALSILDDAVSVDTFDDS